MFHLILHNTWDLVTNHDTTLIDSPMLEPPTMKGYLNKYTNVARGYNTRWFVLKAGILSCTHFSLLILRARVLTPPSDYRHQEDETIASRGSISLKTAVLRVPPSFTGSGAGGVGAADRLRFEVQSTPVRGHPHAQSSGERWYIKANHPVEAARWTQAIGRSIEWYKRVGSEAVAGSGASGRSAESDSDGVGRSSSGYRTSISSTLLKARAGSSKKRAPLSEIDSANSSLEAVGPDASPILHNGSAGENGEDGDGEEGDGDGEGTDGSSGEELAGATPPYEGTFELHGNAAVAQMELTLELLPPAPAPALSPDLTDALRGALATAHGLVAEYATMVREREAWWRGRLARERERQGVWEESLASVVKEGEALEGELRARSRKRGSVFFDDTLKGRGLQRHATVTGLAARTGGPVDSAREGIVQAEAVRGKAVRLEITAPVPVLQTPVRVLVPSPSTTPSMSGENDGTTVDGPGEEEAEEAEGAIDTDEEDEFFDAIEANTLPLVVHSALASPGYAASALPVTFDVAPYAGYAVLREGLGIPVDGRPSASLWAVLKGSIGKDLTRISFPVFFNEPTSMLQRMVSWCPSLW